ncbi:hypothetical protein ALI144C_05040 [Actinosynnema sp. ALI-1.44]|uniref:nSTAND1 domain-containing NTPase n=1 Tax=Actinosynnema sp. ALI-1.44 TaxID=1933779 RepID=UPI00097C9178|nr:helix-turn-helix domain-containing protein [Actinosynnema sp. ALI-1.44]ONI89312.1 hypothetical protein ALI144C_05040 [Actinosynnema sp. ALI-1.44]
MQNPGGFAAELRRLRCDRGLSLAELSRLVHYSKGYLSNIEHGRKPATAELACRLDAALDTGGMFAELIAAAAAPVCPYRGLAAFETEDADWFFGRQQTTATLAGRLGESVRSALPLVVFGASGAGKSSVLRAGLVPALASGAVPVPGSPDWPVLVATPTAHPVDMLAERVAKLLGASDTGLREGLRSGRFRSGLRAALGPQRSRLVLVIDQFEEVFTLCEDESDRRSFIEALCSAAEPADNPPAVVVLGVRADFYDHCLAYPQLLTAVQDNQFAVGAMSGPEVAEAITAPAIRAELDLEPGLVEVLLRDLGLDHGTAQGQCGYQPGALPLLSHALLATWQQRTHHRLTVAGYQHTGGISGALAATAEHVYTSLNPAGQRAARQLLLRLVRVGEDGTDTRRRADRAAVVGHASDQAAAMTALETMAAARLVSLDQQTVEITHEVLLRAWPRLHGWLTEDRAGLRTHHQLTEATSAWAALGRDPGALYRGSRLVTAQEWASTNENALTEPERQFLADSTAAETAERDASRRRTRRLRQLVALLSVLLVLAGTSVGYATHAERQAEKQRDIALARKAAGDAAILRDTDPALAIQLSLAAHRLAPTAETRDNLLSTFITPYASRLIGHTAEVPGVAVGPDSRLVATASADRTARLWDATEIRHPRELATLPHTELLKGVTFTPDGRILATVGDRAVRLWDITDPRQPRSLAALDHPNTVNSVAFNPDGRIAASVGDDRTARVWDLSDPRTPRQLANLPGRRDAIWFATFSPDGRLLVTTGDTVRLWDVGDPQRPRELGTLVGHAERQAVAAVAFHPDNRIVATASDDHTLRLWDISDPQAPQGIATLTGHTGSVHSVAFSPDGQILASTGETTRLWNVADPRHPGAMATLFGGVYSVAFSRDGAMLATAGGDHTARLWNLRELPLTGHTDVVGEATFSPDGRLLASPSRDHTVRLWDTTGPRLRKPVAVLTGHTHVVRGAVFSPDGRTVASSSDDGTVRLWDITDAHAPRMITVLGPHTGEISGIAFSPDGRVLATGGMRTAALWDVTDLKHPRELSRLDGYPQMVWYLAFSPDGRTLLSNSGGDSSIRLWNVTDPAHPRQLPFPFGHTDTGAALRRDGLLLATTPNGNSNDDLVRLVDLSDPSQPREVATLTGHAALIYSARFSPDGRILATAGADNTARLWDVTDPRHPRPLATFTNPAGAVTYATFSPDGRTLATSTNQTITLLATDIDEVSARVCASAHPRMSGTDWQRHFPDVAYQPPCPD